MLASLVVNTASAEDHRQCLELQRCCAHDLVMDRALQYPFQHSFEGPHSCDFVHVPRERIAEIIKSGGIPLISVSRENDLDLQVVRCTPYTTYTAISHVWSDGLGNPYSNAILRCQLLRLREMIPRTYSAEYSPFYDSSSLSSIFKSIDYIEMWRHMRIAKPYNKIDKKRVYFWMDTLCIPVSVDSESSEESKDLKFRAMRHITPVFAGAFTTVVLEKGLQAVRLPDHRHMHGDEFAALILSSKWMLRGWTLEEGSLSSLCIFHMMGMPYDMALTLNRLLPLPEKQQSPFERASLSLRGSLPLLLKRALLDENKQIIQDPWSPRASRTLKLLRVPQFVWVWNSLLECSTTKAQDGPMILANLLDFNVVALKSVPESERLKLLIQNCEELPLSLMYNTGPRLSIREHPQLGWVPTKLVGDQLVIGPTIRRLGAQWDDQHVKFSIERTDNLLEISSEPLLVMYKTDGRIPHDVNIFMVTTTRERHGNKTQEYIIEIHHSRTEDPVSDNEARRVARRVYGQSRGTYLVIDLACGTSSTRGCAGKGARLYTSSSSTKEATLMYEAPLTAWTVDQWQRQHDRNQSEIPQFDMRHVPRRQRLLLEYGTFTDRLDLTLILNLYHSPLSQRKYDLTDTYFRFIAVGRETLPTASPYTPPPDREACQHFLLRHSPGHSDIWPGSGLRHCSGGAWSQSEGFTSQGLHHLPCRTDPHRLHIRPHS